ncbi:MAG: hypothetical protein ACREGJ_04230 [Candidatus Saccharimonadales bacterium]
MEHTAHLVDILDKEGVVVGQKPRRDVDKLHNIYHTIHVLLITPRGELVLGVIPPREDLLNLYARQIGSPMATIRRTQETALEAAKRGLARELFIDHAAPTLLGEKMYKLPDGRYNYMSVFYLVGEAPSVYSILDIDTLVVTTSREFRNMATHQTDEIAPSMHAIWSDYHAKLPV